MNHRLVLRSLWLENFKGITSFIVNPDGKSLRIYGDNATGKTTLPDSFQWLLFGKDSSGDTRFGVRPYNVQRKTFRGSVPEFEPEVKTEVGAVFDLDGQEIKLKKVHYEKWTKKRDTARKVSTGTVTEYYWNDLEVSIKKTEFDKKVSSIINEDVFRLLTDVRHFNENYAWQDRRNLILKVCGDISDQEVIEASPKLKPLQEILNTRPIEAHKAYLADQKKDLNKKIEEVDAQVTEAERFVVEGDINEDQINKRLEEIATTLEDKRKQYRSYDSGGGKAQKEQIKVNLETEIRGEQNRLATEFYKKQSRLQSEYQTIKNRISEIETKISNFNSQIKSYEKRLGEYNEDIKTLEKNIKARRKDKFKTTKDGVCSECGTKLKGDKLEKAKENFNVQKSKDIEDMQTLLEGRKQSVKEVEGNIKELEQKLSQYNQALKVDSKRLKDKQKEYDQHMDTKPTSPELKKLQEKHRKIEKEIQNFSEDDTAEELQKIEEEINNLENERDELKGRLREAKQGQKAKDRVNELAEQEAKLQEQFDKVEQERKLIETFTVQKVKMLEKKINSYFDIVQFKMFRKKSGSEGIVETCETMVDGVPYSDLNHGMRINAGLDIIRTLQGYYNLNAPVWIDNRESITKIIDMPCQVISLIVSEQDKELRVEEATDE